MEIYIDPGFIDLIRRDGVPLEPQWMDDVDFAILTYLVFDHGKHFYHRSWLPRHVYTMQLMPWRGESITKKMN